jgi:hypothetical protein
LKQKSSQIPASSKLKKKSLNLLHALSQSIKLNCVSKESAKEKNLLINGRKFSVLHHNYEKKKKYRLSILFDQKI